MNTKLTPEKVNSMVAAFRRYQELLNQTLETPNKQSEIIGLKEFLGKELFNHANEFIGCWIACYNEYEPLIKLFATVMLRATPVLEANAKAQEQVSTENKIITP